MHCISIPYLIRIYVLTAVKLFFCPFSSFATMGYTTYGKCFAMSTLTCKFCAHVNKADQRGGKRATLEAEELKANRSEKKTNTDAQASNVAAPGTSPQTEMLATQIKGLQKHTQALQNKNDQEQDEKELAQAALARSEAVCQRLKQEQMEVSRQHTEAMTTVIEEMAAVKGDNACLQRWLLSNKKEAEERRQFWHNNQKGKGENGRN